MELKTLEEKFIVLNLMKKNDSIVESVFFYLEKFNKFSTFPVYFLMFFVSCVKKAKFHLYCTHDTMKSSRHSLVLTQP